MVAVDREIVDLAEQFLENRRTQNQEWQEAVEEGNTELLRRLGQDLKGTAGAFGFQSLCKLAEELEDAVGSGDLGTTTDALERLIDVLDRTTVKPS